ncbi:MAG: EamA family transporter [Actinobacteria bacterium]|nr:MAG: EamA family transporter [Actinomycetota bacterium]
MLEATLLALGSAALHAAWNLLVKTSEDRFLAAWGQFLVGGLLFVPWLVLTGLPGSDAWPYLGASSVVHVLYTGALLCAYYHGDFSVAYPVARGGGAVAAAVGGVAFLDDRLSGLAWVAIAVVACGLVTLVSPNVTGYALAWAATTALTIGTYTTLDVAGARDSESGFAYGIVLILGAGTALTVVGLAMGRGKAFVRSLPGSWKRYAFGGAFSTLAYAMVLTAARLAPVGYVAALRESSVVLGAAAGWLLLHEALGRRRLAAALVVVTGLVLLVAWR